MTSVWTASDSHRYAWLVLPFVVYALGWPYRDELLSMVPQPAFASLALVGLGICLWVVSSIIDISLGQHIALILIVLGIIHSTVGHRVFQHCLPVLAILLFMIPAGDLLQPVLRNITVGMIEGFAALSGLPHRIDGYTIYIANLRYVIVAACSGLIYLTLAAFIASCLGCLRYRSLWQVSVCAVLGAFLGVLANGVRVNTIIWLDWRNGTQMDLSQHGSYHEGVMIALLALFALDASRLTVAPADAEAKSVNLSSPPLSAQRRRLAPVIAGLLVLLTLGPLQLFSRFEQAGNGLTIADLQAFAPRGLPIQTGPSSWRVEEAGHIAELDLELKGDVKILVERLLSATGKLGPAVLPKSREGGWSESSSGHLSACAQGRCMIFVHTSWRKWQVEEAQHVVFAYFVGDIVTDSQFMLRAVTGWNRLLGRQVDAGLIAFITRGEIPSPGNLAQWYLQLMSAL